MLYENGSCIPATVLTKSHRLLSLRGATLSQRHSACSHVLQEQARIAAELDARLAAQQAAATEQRRQLEAELAAAQRGEAMPPQAQLQVGACAHQLGPAESYLCVQALLSLPLGTGSHHCKQQHNKGFPSSLLCDSKHMPSCQTLNSARPVPFACVASASAPQAAPLHLQEVPRTLALRRKPDYLGVPALSVQVGLAQLGASC